MGYLHIDNLYKNQDILMFRECYALEKIHGTSAHIKYLDGVISFFSGGESHDRFVALFDVDALDQALSLLGHSEVTVYGEAYGGRCQGMSGIYGKELRFVAFDVRVGECWVSVPDMDQIATGLGLEVVDWVKVATDVEALNAQRDRPSVQSIRNGCGDECPREGVVLRPPIEITKSNGARVIAKHKMDAFSERATPQKVVDPAKLQVLADADAIAQEWVTPMRLAHVLDKLGDVGIEDTRKVLSAMNEDIAREAEGEIVGSKAATRAISKRTAVLFKARLQSSIGASA